MNTFRSLVSLFALALVGCASTRTASPAESNPQTVAPAQSLLYVEYEGKQYVALPLGLHLVQRGDLVAFRDGGALFVATVLDLRSPTVVRVSGGAFRFVSPENYAGRLYPLGVK